MKLPKCVHCDALAASRYVEVVGVDAGGIAYGGRELSWFCVYKLCTKYQQAIDPKWVDVLET